MALLPKYTSGKIEAGIDEAGRGCLAGPVVAAAVILPGDYHNNTLNDSKKISENQRDKLRKQIMKEAISFGVGIVDNQKIDEMNILKATYLAMHQAVEKLTPVPDFLLIDGNRFEAYNNIQHQCIIKGDGLYYSIAAASILAKTERDEIMRIMHKEYPQYHWDRNKGYPTAVHRKAILECGITPLHRKSFNVNPQLSMEF